MQSDLGGHFYVNVSIRHQSMDTTFEKCNNSKFFRDDTRELP